MAETFTGSNPFVVPRAIVNRGGVRVATISAAETWTVKTSTVQVLDGGAANRTITLPTIASSIDGLHFHVYNAGATNDIILSDGGNVVTIVPGDWALVVSEGTDWTLAANSGSPTTTSADNVVTYYGTGNDIGIAWDGTRLNVTQATVNSEIRWGVDGAGIDQKWYTDTAGQSFTLDQSADALVMTAAVSITGQGSTVVPVLPIAAQQALTGAGAINITTFYTAWTTTAADAGTLANGAQIGQLKKIKQIVDGGDGTLTPVSLSGGTTITFADAGDYALLCWNGTAWVAIELGNDADGATAPVLA